MISYFSYVKLKHKPSTAASCTSTPQKYQYHKILDTTRKNPKYLKFHSKKYKSSQVRLFRTIFRLEISVNYFNRCLIVQIVHAYNIPNQCKFISLQAVSWTYIMQSLTLSTQNYLDTGNFSANFRLSGTLHSQGTGRYSKNRHTDGLLKMAVQNNV